MSVIGRIALPAGASACPHCGAALAPGARFCCAGCETAHGLIAALHLDSFYGRRRVPQGALRPDAVPPVSLVAAAEPEGDRLWRLDLMVSGLHCGACVWLVEQALAADPEVLAARVALTSRRLSLRWRGDRARADDFAALLGRLGFRAVPFTPACLRAADDAETRSLTRALGIAAFGAMNVMLVSVAVWVGEDMGDQTRGMMHWLAALIGLPTIAVAGLPFYRSALAALHARRTNMDVAISLGVLATAAMSLSEALRNGPFTYFDGATTLLALLLAGRLLDRTARGRAGRAVAELLALQDGLVRRLAADGSATEVAVGAVRPGDRILLGAGERLRLDAVLEAAPGVFDLAATTGESLPRGIAPGTPVAAGAVNMAGPAVLRVSAAAADGSLAAIARLLEHAAQARGRFVTLADRAARLYVPAVLVVATATFLGWWLGGGLGWQAALVPAVCALIVTCPCGLAIAVPAVQVVTVGALFRRGVLVTSPTALERLAAVDHVVLDKTGTLTAGAPTLLPGGWTPEALRTAASLARGSRHPLARALAAACPDAPLRPDAREHPGLGMAAGDLRLGSARFCGQAEVGILPVLWLVAPGAVPVCFRFADALRPDAGAAVAALQALGLSVEILSGDTEGAVARAAAEVGIADWTAAATPAAKVARIAALRAAGRRPLMVGDGINDAGALALAEAAAAAPGAQDLAQGAADLVLRGEALMALPEAIQAARRAQRLAQQNIGFSLAYNLLAVPAAVAGLVTPLGAAAVMASSSLVVILNALRAERLPRRWTR
ncbi:heavy metal translocating P-type ATPase [Paeniroseomonas aquatica]|uniref:Heavy metal translocating P-type ATPase n=2 Tax=Paeniroseomonas aquatica TaxID=373043 RepID=A0ABT8A2K9_9PROT|nr:heavy metal translocating P-type ATPase [Paeniroseomonas aquatica]MDN3563977.1 heavy metal translocating P-type ATPase [Paeniroseomonas aquatica]